MSTPPAVNGRERMKRGETHAPTRPAGRRRCGIGSILVAQPQLRLTAERERDVVVEGDLAGAGGAQVEVGGVVLGPFAAPLLGAPVERDERFLPGSVATMPNWSRWSARCATAGGGRPACARSWVFQRALEPLVGVLEQQRRRRSPVRLIARSIPASMRPASCSEWSPWSRPSGPRWAAPRPVGTPNSVTITAWPRVVGAQRAQVGGVGIGGAGVAR